MTDEKMEIDGKAPVDHIQEDNLSPCKLFLC